MLASRDSVKKIFQRVLLLALICTMFLLLTGGLVPVQAATGTAWSQSTASAFNQIRSDHTSVVTNSKMWVIGGFDGTGGGFVWLNDVWSSPDGVTWTQAPATVPFLPERYGHTSVVFDNKMWVIGGNGDGGGVTVYLNDVWSSTDGATWTQAPATVPFLPERYYHTSVVFNNKIWVIGGDDGSWSGLNDVWSSTDGATWVQAPATAPFPARYGHTSVVFDNKMFVIGGTSGGRLNDVYYSTDGATWTQATPAAGFSARFGHTSVVFDKVGTGENKMWVIGGNKDDGLGTTVYLKDAWYSKISDPNNVVQLIGLVIAEQVSSDTSGTAPASKEPGAQEPASPAATGAVTAELPVNNQGVVTEGTELQAPDGLATVSIGQGVVALDPAGAPVASVSIDTMAPSEMPDVPQGGAVSFAGLAYELGPNGAQFSPAISITFTAPPGQVGEDYTVRSYDHVTGTWQDLPTSYDPQTGTVTAEVSHFCCFALFTKTVTTKPVIAATPAAPAPKPLIPTTIAPPSPTIATTFVGIILWVVNLMITNPMVIAGIVILVVGIVLIVWKQRRDRLNYRP